MTAHPARRAAAVAVAATLALGACAGSEDDVGTDERSVATGTVPSTSPPVSVDTEGLPSLSDFTISLEEVVEADQPVALVGRSGYSQLYVAERTGKVREVTVTERKDRNGNVTSRSYSMQRTPVLDLSDEITSEGQEQGLLGIAFSPDGRNLYVDYTNGDGNTVVEEYSMSDRRADSRSGTVLLEVDQPAANHNGGNLLYGPDGFLYIGFGDGGNQGDPDGNAQNTESLLGKILRIDPDGATDDRPYGIPPGNPFQDGGGLPEIWLLGVRNPWRFSFDAGTGDLWIGDVGGSVQEEIDRLPKDALNPNAGRGANLGWDRLEGTSRHEGEPPPGAIDPIFTYRGEGDCSVTGGYVYRGSQEVLQGVYLWGDYCGGTIRGLVQTEGVLVEEGTLEARVPNLTSFGEDLDGEVYALSIDGPIYKIVATPTAPPEPPPEEGADGETTTTAAP